MVGGSLTVSPWHVLNFNVFPTLCVALVRMYHFGRISCTSATGCQLMCAQGYMLDPLYNDNEIQCEITGWTVPVS